MAKKSVGAAGRWWRRRRGGGGRYRDNRQNGYNRGGGGGAAAVTPAWRGGGGGGGGGGAGIVRPRQIARTARNSKAPTTANRAAARARLGRARNAPQRLRLSPQSRQQLHPRADRSLRARHDDRKVRPPRRRADQRHGPAGTASSKGPRLSEILDVDGMPPEDYVNVKTLRRS